SAEVYLMAFESRRVLSGRPCNRYDIGEVYSRTGICERHCDGAADPLRRTGYECDLSIEADLHASIRTSSVAFDCGRRLSSTSWIRRTSVSIAGVPTPASRPSAEMIPICGSTSVLRLRTERSRQMPEWVFAVWLVY